MWCSMNKKIYILLITICSIFLNINITKALSVSESITDINIGEEKDIIVSEDIDTNIKKISFYMTWNGIDIKTSFHSSYNCYIKNNLYTITFNKPISGHIELGRLNIKVKGVGYNPRGLINLWGATAVTTDDEKITLNGSNIIINTSENDDSEYDPNEIETNQPISLNIVGIKSNYVNIELEDNVYEYTIDVNNEYVKVLDLIPILEDERATYEITNQNLLEMKDNKIIITVKDNNGLKRDYTFNINTPQRMQLFVDNGIFKKDYSYKNILVIICIPLAIAFIIIGTIIIYKRTHKIRRH